MILCFYLGLYPLFLIFQRFSRSSSGSCFLPLRAFHRETGTNTSLFPLQTAVQGAALWGSYNDKLQQGWYFSFFMLNGICVAFFDLLTYPLVAFGVPLILALLLDGFTTVKEGIKKLATYSFGWIIGYAGMWGGKWLAGSVLTGKDLFSDAIAQIGLRTHGQGGYKGVLTYGNTLKTIWNSINDLPMLILLISFIGIITIYPIRNKRRVSYDINRLKKVRVSC